MSEKEEKAKNNINLLVEQYYKEFDLTSFEKKLGFLYEKLSTLKTEKSRKSHYTELYATYLQLIEIFCINTFVITDNDLENIFLSNSEITRKIEQRFYQERNTEGEDFITFILNKWVFVINNEVKNRIQQKRDYKRVVKESIQDYFKDKDFLNSYKHGFRIVGGEKRSLFIGASGEAPHVKMADYSSSVFYYRKKDGRIEKCQVAFNWEVVYVKCAILLNIIENMQKVCLKSDKEIRFSYLFFQDRLFINKKMGCFRVCESLVASK